MGEQPIGAVLISFIVVANIIIWMVMLAAISLGVLHLNSCPAQPYLPIYLIVLGVATLVCVFLAYIQYSSKDVVVRTVTSSFIAILHMFNFSWFIAGTVWVYTISPQYSEVKDGYCQKNVYRFALFFTSLCWLVIVLVFVYNVCVAFLACCKIATMGNRLSDLHSRSYGTRLVEHRDDGIP